MIRPACRISPHQVEDHYEDFDWVYREVWGEHVHHGLWRTGRESAVGAGGSVDHPEPIIVCGLVKRSLRRRGS